VFLTTVREYAKHKTHLDRKGLRYPPNSYILICNTALQSMETCSGEHHPALHQSKESMLPTVWVPPEAVRELRILVSHRRRLIGQARPSTQMILLTAMGDITRFSHALQLVGYARLRARVHDSAICPVGSKPTAERGGSMLRTCSRYQQSEPARWKIPSRRVVFGETTANREWNESVPGSLFSQVVVVLPDAIAQ